MGWLDAWEWRAREAIGKPEPPRELVAKPAKPRPAKPLHQISIQSSAPNGDHVGSVEVGYYTVDDGLLEMCDESGKSTGKKHALRPDDDPAAIARCLKRAAWSDAMGEGNFNRPLNYPNIGVV